MCVVFTPNMELTHCVPIGRWELIQRAGYKSSTGHAWCTGCWRFYTSPRATSVIRITQLQATPVTPSLDFPQFLSQGSICGFYTTSQEAGFIPNAALLSSSLSFILVLYYPPVVPPLTHTQLYIHDALYRHLVHIEDCHCHLLIITVTCTLHSVINTWRNQWRAMASQCLFRSLRSWWEKKSAAETENRLI